MKRGLPMSSRMHATGSLFHSSTSSVWFFPFSSTSSPTISKISHSHSGLVGRLSMVWNNLCFVSKASATSSLICRAKLGLPSSTWHKQEHLRLPTSRSCQFLSGWSLNEPTNGLAPTLCDSQRVATYPLLGPASLDDMSQTASPGYHTTQWDHQPEMGSPPPTVLILVYRRLHLERLQLWLFLRGKMVVAQRMSQVALGRLVTLYQGCPCYLMDQD